MSDRRPVRARKAIDYSKFGRIGDDDDSPFKDDDDDDFAEPTAPPNKRAKKEKAKTTEKKSAVMPRPVPTPRPSLQEKVFERELQLALEMSAVEGSPPPVLEHAALIQPQATDYCAEPPPLLPEVPIGTEEKENQVRAASNVVSMEEDESSIEVVERDVKEKDSRVQRHRKRPAARSYAESESEDGENKDAEYQAPNHESSDESESDDDDFKPEDEDSDVDCKKKKSVSKPSKKVSSPKKPAAKATKKAKAAVQPRSPSEGSMSKPPKPSNSLPSTAVSKTRTPLLKTVASSSPRTPLLKTAVSSSSSLPPQGITSPGIGKRGKWNPPSSSCSAGSPSSSADVKSPSAGLRLGLSRNIRIKPLHANVKVPD